MRILTVCYSEVYSWLIVYVHFNSFNFWLRSCSFKKKQQWFICNFVQYCNIAYSCNVFITGVLQAMEAWPLCTACRELIAGCMCIVCVYPLLLKFLALYYYVQCVLRSCGACYARRLCSDRFQGIIRYVCIDYSSDISRHGTGYCSRSESVV